MRVSGEVLDLQRGPNGQLLYCTREGEVGLVNSRQPRWARRQILAAAGTMPGFGSEARAVARDLNGAVVIANEGGDIYRLDPNWVLVYDDTKLIRDTTDLLVDEDGNFLLASATPSTGQRGTNRVSPNGAHWGYLRVSDSPLQLAADPLTGQLLFADSTGSGAVRMIDNTSDLYPVSVVDSGTSFGFTAASDDGDIACEADGDFYVIDGGTVWFRDRALGQTTLFASGYGQLRGAVIANSTARYGYGSWSLYLAEGSNPTIIREIPGVGNPAPEFSGSFGPVPDQGQFLLFASNFRLTGGSVNIGIQIQALAADNYGNLLLGGEKFSSDFRIVRYDPSTGALTEVAHESDGLSGRIMGLVVAADDTIFALTRAGNIDRITENPVSVTTVYTDPTDRIQYGFHLALDVDGRFYVADRNAWGAGEVLEISSDGSSVTQLVSVAEARGVTADPNGGGLYITEWNGPGFNGEVERYDFGTAQLTALPGFTGVNYSNWYADGDTVVDVLGNIYSCSEDDWSVLRWQPADGGFARVGSSYQGKLSALEIAPSTLGAGSTTGWSLYVSDRDRLFEIISVPAPAYDLVDANALDSSSLTAVLDPTQGRPRDLLGASGQLFVSTSTGVLQGIDPASGEVQRIAGPEDGLYGDLIELERSRADELLIANRAGDVFSVRLRREGALVRVLAGGESSRGGLGGPLRGFVLGRDPLAIGSSKDPWFALIAHESQAGFGTRIDLVSSRGFESTWELPGAFRPRTDPRSGDIRLRPAETIPMVQVRGRGFRLKGWSLRMNADAPISTRFP